ncbi:hypothetical protein [Vibrio sp. D431a]|uniref:hypothetical protein n=1 Tax=Vibrio sp. D431a TaxID=2837388 RepID=UPI0025543424|nr:hypothetical protein [Vibrio sp. D431a]MDK9790704.1 hypothetical protein [Vibrio sp. D431a]
MFKSVNFFTGSVLAAIFVVGTSLAWFPYVNQYLFEDNNRLDVSTIEFSGLNGSYYSLLPFDRSGKWKLISDCTLPKGSRMSLLINDVVASGKPSSFSYYFVELGKDERGVSSGCPADAFYVHGKRDSIKASISAEYRRERILTALESNSIRYQKDTSNSNEP